MQYKEARVNDALADDGDVVEHVLCLLKACRGVDVTAELGTDTLQILKQFLVGEILCTVETHVLKEVGKTVLVVLLLESTYICRQVELGTLCRLRIVTDVIGKSVLELANSYIRVNRQYCLRECCQCNKRCNQH